MPTHKSLVPVVMVFLGTLGSCAPVAKDAGEISNADRALAMLQVQNTMSRHAYYHATGDNLAEIDALWVDRNGANARTATFASPMWVMNGLEVVRRAYGEENQKRRADALTALAAVDPGVKDIPANLGAGHEWAMHTNTTPVIEVAGDGNTAKGVWYSPGMGLFTKIENGKAVVGGVFFWEKYGGDFIRENGVWKIWHLQMAYDFTPGLPREWTDPLAARSGISVTMGPGGAAPKEAGERMTDMPPGFTKPKYSYPNFSPGRPGIIYPPLPVPYSTFSETFSY